jgi:sialate O-acetylesterase
VRSLAARLAAGAVLFGTASGAAADVRLAGVFGDHMVLQRDAPIRVWGTARAGEAVRVSLSGAPRSTRARADGRWQLQLPAAPAGGPHVLTVSATNTRVLRDVLVGDVWLCAGQSNMEWTVAQSQGAAAEIAAADHPRIRHLKLAHRASLRPQDDMDSVPWQVSSPATAGQFGAVAYFFAVKLQQSMGAANVRILGRQPHRDLDQPACGAGRSGAGACCPGHAGGRGGLCRQPGRARAGGGAPVARRPAAAGR